MRKSASLILILYYLILLPGPLQALNTQIGIRAFLDGGYASGKGLWDWTDSQDTGTLQWGKGGGCGLVSRFELNQRFLLEGGINYVYISAAQTLDNKTYNYSQFSIETPLLFKTRLPFEKTEWYLGAGPNLIFLFFNAERNGVESIPEKPVMLALQCGLDYRAFKSDKFDLLISANFIHPVTSPEYDWEENSSGSIRINRFEICVTWLLFLRKGKS